MLCPNKNSKEWKDLMALHGDETLATIHYFKSDSIVAKTHSEIKAAIKLEVQGNEEEYQKRYSSYLKPIIDNSLDTNELVEAFALRFKDTEALLKGDVVETPTGNMLLFPEASEEFTEAFSTPKKMDSLLQTLSDKFNIPFRVVNDASQKWAGKYINDGNKKVVFINLAYADETTPLHEYYHPFVRVLSLRNPTLFESIYNQAVAEGDNRMDKEEVVTSFLETKASVSKQNSFLNQFFEFIKRILKIPVQVAIDTATNLEDLLQLAQKGLNLSSENTLTKAYKKVDVLEQAIRDRIKVDNTAVDYINAIQNSNLNLTTNDGTNFYQDETGKDILLRLTAFIGDKVFGEFSQKSKKYKYTVPEANALLWFKQKGINLEGQDIANITAVYSTPQGDITFQQVLEAEEAKFNSARVYGKMVHSYMQYLLETNPELKRQIKNKTLEYAKQYGESFYTLDTHPHLKELNNNLEEILRIAGINLDIDGTKGLPKKSLDRVAAEIVLRSNLLTDSNGNYIGTTADGLVQHPNGDVSLVDWKTGGIASDFGTAFLMKYGEKFDITDSKMSKGYLELAFRALMLKEQFPDITFRDIKLVRLTKRGEAQAHSVDLQQYLYVIGEYYKENNPQTYKILQEKGLLDATNYEGISAPLDKVMASIEHLPYDEQLLYLKTKLAALHKGKSKAQIENDSALSKQSAVYANALLDLEKTVGTDLKSKGKDLPTYPFITGFKNFSDIANPKIQTLHKVILEAKNRVTKTNAQIDTEHNEHYKKVVLKDNKALMNVVTVAGIAGFTFGFVTFSPIWMGLSLISYNVLRRQLNKTTKQHFAFMWRESSDPGKPGFYLNTQDYYMLDGVRYEMTKEQKDYRDYIQRSMQEAYNKFANTIVGYINGNEALPIYRYQDLGLPQTLPEDFMPRVPKDIEEIREEENYLQGFMGLKTVIGESARRSMTSFMEDNFQNQDTKIPLRFFKHSGSAVVDGALHSFNVEGAFKAFMASMHYKEEMDPVYDLAVGASNALREEFDEQGNQRYPNLLKWLDDSIYPIILQNQKDVQLKTRRWNKKVGFVGSKLTGIPQGTPYVLSQNSVLKALKTSVTYSVMSFKVFSPVRNAIMIGLMNLSQSTKHVTNSALQHILGVPPETFEGIDPRGASVALRDFVKAKMLGKEESSKLWNIAKKMDWLPDNYAYEVNNDRLLSKAIKLSPTSHAFMFYNIGETFGALWQLAGLLQGTKVQNKDGKTVSLWEAYNEKGDWTLGVRGLKDLGNGIVEELSDLDALEIKSLKRAYEKLQGSYRSEEKTAIEATVLGDFIMQFQKYFYQYLKVLFADPYRDITVGKYVMEGKRPDGMPVYQWHADVMEGQLRVLAGAFLAVWSRTPLKSVKKYLTDSDQYGPNTLKGSRARALATLINTYVWFILLLWAFMGAFDEDDRNTYVGKQIDRTILDMTRGAHLTDLLENVKKPAVVLDRISKTGIAMVDFFTKGIQGKTTKDGWPVGSKTILRSVPGAAGALQMMDVSKNEAQVEKLLFDLIPMR